MKKLSNQARLLSKTLLVLAAGVFCIWPEKAEAVSSPYTTVQQNVPLNQAPDDSINGLVPFYSGTIHTPPEPGSIARLSDAASPDTPAANVIMGPDHTDVRVAWDLGDPAPGMMWRLDRIDLWIAAFDDLRKGFRGHFEVSLTGADHDYEMITNSFHWEGLSQNDNFNYIRYDFPEEFIAGDEPIQDRYPVTGFRYLLLNSRGDQIPFPNGTDWQSRFTEIDVWVSQIPAPSEVPVIQSVTRDEGGNIHLTWSAIPGRTYGIEYQSDLDAPAWTPVDYIYAESQSVSHSHHPGDDAARFYRVVLYP